MAFSLVSHGFGAFATSASFNSTGADLLVAVYAGYSSAVAPSNDSKGNTWTRALNFYDTVTPNYASIWYVVAPTVGSGHTLAVVGGTSYYAGWCVACFSGALQSSPLDANTVTNIAGSGTTIQPGSVTPSANNELVICGIGARFSATAPSISGNGFTITDSMGNNGTYNWATALAYVIQTSAAAVNPTWTLSSAASTAGIVSFKAAAGGVSITTRRSFTGNLRGR
jgi:hypothetical protein